MIEVSAKKFGNRLAFLGVVAWISICLLIAGMYPELHRRLSFVWVISGMLGLITAVGLAEVVKRELRHQAQIIETFKTEAYTDSLTRLPNRRALDQALGLGVAAAGRNGQPLALIIIDIDYFKIYNDTFGHGAGDELLRRISRIMEESFRDEDLVARFGGEEFAIILPHTELHSAIRVAHRLRESVEVRTTKESMTGSGVTISLGLTMARSSDSPKSLMQRADTALYCAKNAGRNCGYFEDDTGCHPIEPTASETAAETAANVSLFG